MANGEYKNGVAIIATYQAANCGTGLTVLMDIYDEAHAKDEAKCIAAMTEIGATGRYYATFTPDAEGEWIALMYISAGVGEVVKSFAVAGHNLDGVGDAVDAIQTDLDNATDGLGALKTLIEAVPDSDAVNAACDTAISDADLATATNLATVAGYIDTEVAAIQTDLDNETDGLGALKAAIDTTAGYIDTEVGALKDDLDNETDGLGALKALIDTANSGIGAIASPAMVG